MITPTQHIASACFASLAIFGCTSANESSRSQTLPAAQSIQLGDLVACDRIVRNDLVDEAALYPDYDPRLRTLLRRAYNTLDDTGLPVYNADHRYKSQDGAPPNVTVMPAVERSSNEIAVPVVMQWQGNPPYTVTWILRRSGGRWLIADLVTVGHGFDNGSLLAYLSNAL
jgi:hypothetical protein